MSSGEKKTKKKEIAEANKKGEIPKTTEAGTSPKKQGVLLHLKASHYLLTFFFFFLLFSMIFDICLDLKHDFNKQIQMIKLEIGEIR